MSFIVIEEHGSKAIKPLKVVEHRWFSIFMAAKVIKELWPYLVEFFTNISVKSKKAETLRHLFGDNNKQSILFFKINYLVNKLEPIQKIQKKFETNSALSHQIYHLFNCELTNILSESTFNNDLKVLLQSFSLSKQKALSEMASKFNAILTEKWKETSSRNLNEEVYGVDGILKKCLIFNPHTKESQRRQFDYYSNLFNLIEDKEIVRKEFNEYMLEDKPGINEITPIKFWLEAKQKYPNLSVAATTWLSLSCTSLDAERSFSRFRDVQTFKRSSLTPDNLKRYAILYFNGDIENSFDL